MDVDYEPDRPDPNAEPVAQEKEEEDINAEYVKMELPCIGNQRMM